MDVASSPAIDAPLVRERLLGSLSRTPIGLIEAGAGYGKSTLASQYRHRLGIATAYVPLGPPDADPGVLAGSLRRALEAARLSDLAAATEGASSPEEWVERLLDALSATDEGVLVVLDDVHHLTTTASSALVARLARGLPDPHRLLVAARSFVRALEPLWSLTGATRLQTAELAFTPAETAELLRDVALDAHSVGVIHDATRGWATALVLATRIPAAVADGSAEPVGAALRAILDSMDETDRALAHALSHLPVVSPELADAVADRAGGFERLVAAGVPIARVDTGWWEMPSPVATYLAAQRPPSPEALSAAVEIYARHGSDLLALRTLTAAGEHGLAAERLAGMDIVSVERLGLGVVDELVGSLSDEAVDANPRVLLHLARLCEPAHRGEARSHALARAAAADGVASDPVLTAELDAERARDLMWDTRTRGEARTLAEAVLERPAASDITRARALDTLGRLDCWFSETGPHPAAEQRLLASARLARALGQRTWTAQALVALAAGYHFSRCEYVRALEVHDEALGELPARNRYRAMVHNFRAETLIELGRAEDAASALGEMRAIGTACREEWVLAYAAWQSAELASYRGDGAATIEAYEEAMRHRDDWYEQPSGLEFEVQAADYLSRVGERRVAFAALKRARERRAASEHLVAVHEAAVLARSGDTDEAWTAIDAVLADPATEPQERWPLLLLRAHLARRCDARGTGALAAEAFEAARAVGHPAGPLIREAALAGPLLELALAHGSTAARRLAEQRDEPEWAIRLLGGFEVRDRDAPVTVPPGRPARAVQIVAATGGRLHTEALTELLWPEAPPAVGRNRLRNLLSRLRTACGDLLLRDGPAIVLAPGTRIDAAELQRAAREAHDAAQAGERGRSAVIARQALQTTAGELLPDEPYAEWAIEPRRRARACELDLLDLLRSAAERQGEIDEAVRLARRGIVRDPENRDRYSALAELLRSQGRTGAAAAVLRERSSV